jgi:hypothetical protein
LRLLGGNPLISYVSKYWSMLDRAMLRSDELSAPAASVSAPNGWPRSVRVRAALFVASMILLFGALALLVEALGSDTYSGADGKFNQDLITTHISFARPLIVNTVNPLVGVFSQLYPLNVWLNPGFITFSIFSHETALVASTAIFLFIYCLSIYVLARTVDTSSAVAVIAAQLGAFVFPPLYHFSGLLSNYDLLPGGSLTAALFMFLLCVILRQSELSWRSFAIGVTLSTALIGYIVYNDPLTMGVIGFSFVVPFGVAILAGKRGAIICLRLLVLAAAGAILYAIGLVDYVLAMDHYTARYYFRYEFFRPQTTDFASVLFLFPPAGRTYGFLVSGWVAGLLLCRGAQRLIPLMAAINFIWLILYASLYLFGTVHWFAPIPIYVETYTIQIAGLGAVVGWAALLQWVIASASSASVQWFAQPRLKAIVAIGASAFVPVLVGIQALRIPTWMHGIYHEPWVDEAELVTKLKEIIGLHEGAEFQGTVYVNKVGYRDGQTNVNLWRYSIPTFNEYNQLSTPAYELLRTRVLMRTKPDTEHMKGFFSSERLFVTGELNFPGLAAVGTRFLLSTDQPSEGVMASGDPHALLRGEFTGKIPGSPNLDRKWFLYELTNPNRGQFNPRVVRLAKTAPLMVAAMRMSDFAWDREVYLSEPLREELTTARNVRMVIRRGTVDIHAETDGTTLVLLPVQYSHCLLLAGAPEARLVRADFLLTGVVFAGAINATLDFNYGFFNAACRRADTRDMDLMEATGSEHLVVPKSFQNPFAITSLRMAPVKIYEALANLKCF